MFGVLRCLPFLFVAVILACGPLAAAGSDPPGIKREPAKAVHSVDGKVLYDSYCAACHGPTGRGNGPAARYLSVPVPDLSTLAVRDGEFKLKHVKFHITDQEAVGAVMPHWNDILMQNFGDQQGFKELAVHNLARHVARLQVARVQP